MSHYLRLTIDLLGRAFPKGLSEVEYFGVLAVLYPHMSDRNLAEVMSSWLGRDRSVVYNDVLGIDGRSLDQEVVDRVQQTLANHGLEDWLREA